MADLRDELTARRLENIEEIDEKMKKLLALYQELKEKENIKELARRDQDKFLELHSWNYPLSTVAELEDKSILEELKSRV